MTESLTTSATTAPSEAPRAAPTAWSSFLLELRRTRLGVFSAVVVCALILLAILAPVISPYPPNAQNLMAQFEPPSVAHLFGTDEFGRDIFTRVLYGGRISLLTGVVAVVLAVVVGVPLGLIAGYSGRTVDTIIMRIMDVFLSIPAILLAMAIVAVLGIGSFNAMIAAGIVFIPTFARLARASTLALKHTEFVEAARSIGCTDLAILRRTILPNVLGPIIIQMSVAAAVAILLAAALSFLGLGTRPPDASWGQMLSSGRSFLHRAWWYGFFPGLALTLLVMALNYLSDVLQIALDPRQRTLRASGGNQL